MDLIGIIIYYVIVSIIVHKKYKPLEDDLPRWFVALCISLLGLFIVGLIESIYATFHH